MPDQTPAYTAVLYLFVLNLIYIAVLPKIFFKSGKFNLMWWLTALPFLIDGFYLLFRLFGGEDLPYGLGTMLLTGRGRMWMEMVAIPLATVSIFMMGMTIGTHQIPLALWHQKDDAPASIVTHGPYRLVRHPFYASFLLTLLGILLVEPTFVTLFAWLYGCVQFSLTAQREETRLCQSELGEEYRRYMARTGRFFPKLFQSGGSTAA